MAVAVGPYRASRLRRARGALTPPEWRRALVLLLAVLGLHVAGFGLLLGVVVPQHLRLHGGAVFGVGLGITAYALGLRHAFDADHIAAIDNTTRKLMSDRQRPLSVGFWFSLGHSSVVFGLCLLLGIGVRALAGQVQGGGSAPRRTTGLIGTTVSGVVLYLIGI